jgi:mannose/fructose/N-acetylgalactosamine-specific phosphotransferase system component IID
MLEEMETSRRLLYGAIAASFFVAGLILIVLLFWLVFPVVIGLGLWALAGLFFWPGLKGAHVL